jgi:uncharacterized RDD family membrane protein YckC
MGRRFAARLIDCWIIFLPFTLLWALWYHSAISDCNGVSRCEGFGSILISIFVFEVASAGTVMYEWISLSLWGRTLGKLLVGLRVTHVNGSPPGTAGSLARAVVVWLSIPFLSIALYIPYLALAVVLSLPSTGLWQPFVFLGLGGLGLFVVNMALMGSGRRPIHDLVAGTTVDFTTSGTTGVQRRTRTRLFGGMALGVTAIGIAIIAWAVTNSRPHELNAGERQSYIADNQQLLDSLPQVPGTQQYDVQSYPYCTNGIIIGYSTSANIKTPTVKSHQQIVDFYVEGMGESWGHSVTEDTLRLPNGTTGIGTTATFKRGSSIIWFTIVPPPYNGITSEDTYQVMVDSHGASGHSCHED